MGFFEALPRLRLLLFDAQNGAFHILTGSANQIAPGAPSSCPPTPLFSSAGPQRPPSPLPPPCPAPPRDITSGAAILEAGARRRRGRAGARAAAAADSAGGGAAGPGPGPGPPAADRSPRHVGLRQQPLRRPGPQQPLQGEARSGGVLRGSGGGARAALVGDGESRLASWGRPVSPSVLQLRACKSRFKHFIIFIF